ncbi:MAG: aminomethyl-transferring glycine dehydrogenase subunit GcvPA [Spirochaetia bacterium]|nr:aminomethyl-transferring glycine dehydrogenase subunit GcvPA [Spirochaetia bacterium]
MYFFNSAEETKELLDEINISNIDELFKSIPADILKETHKSLEKPLKEYELQEELKELSRNNFQGKSFLGYGLYKHYIPESVNHLSSLRPFVTSYTPYQPEAAQGTLQALFEYQSLMAELTSMDIANASLYDGATSLVEAMRMAVRMNKSVEKKIFLLSEGIHPLYLKVVDTYFSKSYQNELNIEIKTVPLDKKTGSSQWHLYENEKNKVLGAAVQNPNYFGVVENNISIIKEIFNEAQFLYGTNEPHALTILKSPKENSADIVWGEAQSLGIPVSMGGPSLGFIAAKKEYMRQMPGRLVGKTSAETAYGEETFGFVITLSTREQHIRREKATSNICSNQTLMAIRAAIYMSALGWKGMQNVIIKCVENTEFFKNEILKKKDVKLLFPEAVYFHEVAWIHPNQKDILEKGFANNIAAGVECSVLENINNIKTIITYFSEEHKEKDILNLIKVLFSK